GQAPGCRAALTPGCCPCNFQAGLVVVYLPDRHAPHAVGQGRLCRRWAGRHGQPATTTKRKKKAGLAGKPTVPGQAGLRLRDAGKDSRRAPGKARNALAVRFTAPARTTLQLAIATVLRGHTAQIFSMRNGSY